MTTQAIKRGDAARLYANTNTFSSVVAVSVPVVDLHFVDKPGKLVDVSDRNLDVNTFIYTRSDWTIEFDFFWNPINTQLAALVAALRARTNIEYIVTDDNIATSGTLGLHAEWICESGWDNDAKLADGQRCKVKLVPAANYTNAPVRWVT